MDWSRERAIVTGGSGGIGLAVVNALKAKGAQVVHCSRSGGGVGGGFACDVRSEASVAAFAAHVQQALGVPTLLVNNAGVAKWGKVAEQSLADWEVNIATNLTGMFLVTRAFLPAMLAAGTGTIVNVASLAGRNGIAGGAAYSASKHGVLGFSKSLMAEVRKAGLRVIAVCPGSVGTALFEKDAAPFASNPETILKPEDVAQAILDAVALPQRAMVSELDIRPSNP